MFWDEDPAVDMYGNPIARRKPSFFNTVADAAIAAAATPATLSVPDANLGYGAGQPGGWQLNEKFRAAVTAPPTISTGPGTTMPAPQPMGPPAPEIWEPPLNSMKPGAVAPSGPGTFLPSSQSEPMGPPAPERWEPPLNSMKPGAVVPSGLGAGQGMYVPSSQAEQMGPVYDEAARNAFLGTGGDLGRVASPMSSDAQWSAAATIPRNPYADLLPVDPYAAPIHTLGVNGFRTGASSPMVDYNPVINQQNALRHNRGLLGDIMRNESFVADRMMRNDVGMAMAGSRGEMNQARIEAMQEAAAARGQRAIADPRITKTAKEGLITNLNVPEDIKSRMLVENQMTNPKPGGGMTIAAVGKDLSFADVMANAGKIPSEQLRSYLELKGIDVDSARKRLRAIADSEKPESVFIRKLYPELSVAPMPRYDGEFWGLGGL